MQKAIQLIKKFTPATESIPNEEYLLEVEAELHKDVPFDLNSNQVAALVSLVSDLGYQEFLNSTIYTYLKRGNLSIAASQFSSYARVGRVMSIKKITRRNAEKELFLSREF